MASSCTPGSQKSLQTSPPAYTTTSFHPAGQTQQPCSRRPAQPSDRAPTSEALTIYEISVLRGGDFGYSAQGIKDRYVALSCLHVGKTTLKAVMDRLGRPAGSLYDPMVRPTKEQLGGKPTLRCGHQIRELLGISRTIDVRDRETIELHLSILREFECIPPQAVFEVRRDCSRFKRHVEKFRHYWTGQPIQQIINEYGDDMSIFLMTWLESLAAHATEPHGVHDFSLALDRVFEWREYCEMEMKDQDYSNIILALLRSYIHQTFLRRRHYPRRCSAERYAVALFTRYAESIECLARLCHPNLKEASFLHSFAYTSTRLDPIERAIFFYTSLFLALKMRWDTRAHRRLIEAYYTGFTQRSGASLALAFITMKHATLLGLQHLYVGTCMLARMYDLEAWELAWTEVLHLISDAGG
ncbi:hypothetical protein LTR53_000019 [Teratosphaeriaceae sp. CCFEE 6253]|nr:hypothetical protein LTR53_000019 [Teratosphaeriaceae sp. CCFEE 6253]